MTHPYASRAYAQALAGEGSIIHVSELDTWAIPRQVAGTDEWDAQMPYPFSPIARPCSGVHLRNTLKEQGIVSLVGVTDALDDGCDWYPAVFDFVRPYKDHYVIDRDHAPVQVSRHHRYEIRKSERVCETGVVSLQDRIDEWCALYDTLVARHRLGRSHKFSRSYFEVLARMPEFVAIGATIGGRLVSCHIWVRFDGRAYSHLSASSEEGYHHAAAYSVMDYAIAHFDGCRLIDLGGVPDNSPSGPGLQRFKKGFANGTRRNWICGSIVDRDRYDSLSRGIDNGPAATMYFPAYRALGQA